MPDGSSSGTLRQIWKAVKQLNPGRTMREADRTFRLALIGVSDQEVAAMREFLVGPAPSETDARRAGWVLGSYTLPLDDSEMDAVRRADFTLASQAAEAEIGRLTDRLFVFDHDKPGRSLAKIAASPRGREMRLSLGKHLTAFRQEVSRRMIRDVSRENAVFVIATALGNVVPSVFQPLLGVAEAAGDTIFLTANQVRMLFGIGAAYGKRIGYAAQWREISSIIGAAFGWRSLARELVSKIPFGAGLVPKGAVAYAGTTVVGEGLILLYATGRKMTREEVAQAFKRAYSDAVEVVRSLVGRLRPAAGSGAGST